MAERTTSDTPLLDEGVYRPDYRDTAAAPGILGSARDFGLKAVAGAIDLAATPFAYARDASIAAGDKEREAGAQLAQRQAIDFRNWVNTGKSEYAQQEDRTGNENSSWLGKAVDTIVGGAPAMAAGLGAGALGGPLVGGAVYAAIADAQQSADFEEKLYNMPRDQLKELPVYKELQAQGLDHLEIMRQIHSKMRYSPEARIPNIAANFIFSGIAGKIISKVGTRSLAQSMTQNILRNLGQDVPEAVIGGALTGGAQTYGSQAGEVAGGLRKEVDWHDVRKSGVELGTTLGAISGVSALARSRRPPPGMRPRADTTGDLMKDADLRKPGAPEIGTEQRIVATDNLSDDVGKDTSVPPRPEPTYPQMPDTGVPGPARAPEAPLLPQFPDVGRPETPGFGHPYEPEVTQPSKPPEGVVPRSEGGVRFRDLDAVTDALMDLEHQLRSLEAASPEQKATAEWKQAHEELLQEHDRARVQHDQLAAVEVPPEGVGETPVAGPIIGGVETPAPTPVLPRVAAAIKPVAAKAATKVTKTASDAAGAPVEVVEPQPDFGVEALKKRAADVAQTPDMGTLQKHIAEWQAANPGQKLSDLNEIRATAKAAIEAERQKGVVAKQEAQKTAREEKARQRAEDKAVKDAAKETERADAAQRAIAKQQAAGFAKAAKVREQAEALKKKAKPPEEVTPAGKPEAEVKPEPPKVEELPPADEKPNVNTLRAKLGLKPVEAGVTHGPAATPDIIAQHEVKTGRAREAMGTVTKGLEKAEKTGRATEGQANLRDPKYSERETTAKAVIEEHQPGHNAAAEIAHMESIIKEGEPGAAHVREAVAELAKEAKTIFDDYKGQVTKKASGPDDPIWNIARGGGKSRARKGDYHGFISDLNNYVIDVNKAIEKGDHTKAKELTLKYLEDTKSVREGDMATVVEARKAKNEAVTMVKRTFSNQKGEIDRLSKDQLDRLTPEDRAIYNEELAAEDTRLRQEAGREEEKTVGKLSEKNVQVEADVAESLAKNPVRIIKPSTAKSKGIPIPKVDPKTGKQMRDGNGRAIWIDPMYPKETVGRAHEYTNGKPEELHDNNVDDLEYRLKAEGHAVSDELKFQEISDVFRAAGEPISKGTVKDLLKPHRPDDPHLRPIFDAVYDVVKDMPVEIWSRDAMVAYSKYTDPGGGIPLGFYDPLSGHMVIRRDAQTPMVIFHESIHAATSRAILGSERLEALVNKLQDIIESRHKGDINVTAELPWQRAIRGVPAKGQKTAPKVNAREFIAELFSRPELGRLLSETNLTPAEARALKKLGYRADIGQSILKTLWREFLEAIGFKASNPNAYKVSVDLLQDMFEREMQIRETDQARGTLVGQILTHDDRVNLWKADRIGGAAAIKQFEAGNFPGATTEIMRMNERGFPDEKSADAALKLLDGVNKHYWRDNSLEIDPPPPIKTAPEIHSGVIDYIEQKIGPKAADKAWQFENKFATPLRNFVKGMQYTNDIGRHLEGAFQAVLEPLKDAWSRRENFTQKYMDETGANTLIDKIATMKHQVQDKTLWRDFENLLVRESYAQAYSDQALGMGHNEHIKAGDLRWRQTEADYKTNKTLLDKIAARDPELIKLRDEIYDFTRKELDTRQKANVRDMLLNMKVASPGDEVAISGFSKEIRHQDKTITPAERTAMDRVLKLGKESDVYRNWELERKRLERTVGKASPDYTKHMGREAKLLASIDSKEYQSYKKARGDIRKIVDFEKHNGPHVPFMRHGNHAVYAEYDVKPDEGVRYNEVDPDADLHKQFDFANLKDAENFIDNTLSHPDVNITVNNAYSVVYDTSTGARAAHWTVEKPDRSAKTYTDQHEAEAAMEKGDTISKKFTTMKDVEQMREAGQDVGHFEERHRVVFNPKEFVKFESEREAHNYREHINRDAIHPNVVTRVSNVETPHDMIGRANVAYTSAEMKNWIKREEQSSRYQRMDPTEKAEWSRQMRVHAARVTATAGRRTAHMPREYAKGASTDILKNMIDYAGSSARAVADLTYRNDIDRGLEGAEAYVNKYRDQSGGLAGNHRARDDALREIKTRLFAPPQVDGTWAQGIKRALQVSMISHLADTAYLIVNAIEPWVFGASISSARHGWASTYGEMASTTKMLDAQTLAATAWQDIKAAGAGRFGANMYEKVLLKTVTGERNTRGDGVGLSRMLDHMFNKGLAARDVGMEVERIHDPSKNWTFRQLDRVDNVFRGFNTGVETFNRALLGVSNYRLEYARAMKDMGLEVKAGELNEKAHEQAVRYAEDMIFKAAGDYGAWNNPRYFNNPMLKLAMQFKKYPLRIASVYMDAAMAAFKGDRQAQYQLAYMTIAQVVAAGGMGLPINSLGAGVTNALYMLGLTDSNWDDVEWAIHKGLTDRIGVTGTELAMHGALRFSGADFSSKLAQNSFLFHGSPTSRRAGDYIETLGKMALGAPGHSLDSLITGVQKTGQGVSELSSGATTQGMASGMEGLSGIIQIKALTDAVKATTMAFGGPKGQPSGTEATAGQILSTGLGFQPTSFANKAEAKRVTQREIKKDSEQHTRWVNRWLSAPDTEKAAIWNQIQKNNESIADPRLRIQYQELWKAKQRQTQQERRDELKLGVKMSGRAKAFADIGNYFNAN